MGNKKRLREEEVKVFVAGSVSKEVKRKLLAYARVRQVNMARMVGGILSEWNEQMPEIGTKAIDNTIVHNHGKGVRCNKSCPRWEEND